VVLLLLKAVKGPAWLKVTKKKKDVSIHILPTAANLLGICFLVFSLISVLKLGDQTFLDELVTLAIVDFLFASLASYASLRVITAHGFYRKAADIFFISGSAF
jgi:hypothetical protein